VLQVYENRETRTGRRISLNIVALPSLALDPDPDPLFFLAGGPGQGAAQMASDIREIFRPVLRRRDIVLVDQRGTGKSNPLECRSESNTLQELTESDEGALERLRKCLAGYDADVRFYTTPLAMDDLDDVRAHLGYEQINLYGGSYGTRAALVYVRQHGAHVRSMILDGVAPTDMRIPLFAARDAQRALDKLLADCEADVNCRAAQPRLPARVRALLERLSARPARVEVMHPRTGIREAIVIDARIVAGILFGALYSPLTASLVPALVARAEQNDFQNLLALAYAGEAADNMSIGMQLSVLCAEDAPRVTSDDVRHQSEGTVFGVHLLRGQLKACTMWPRGHVDDSYFEPVRSDVPALVLSGDLDPVTPPGWGDSVAQHLENARHITVPATGHGVIGTPCGQELIRQFIEHGSADGLDVSCVKRVRRPPFFLTPSGAQ
jgi:pimeloyl-ACP methyl ester carboxylesterase